MATVNLKFANKAIDEDNKNESIDEFRQFQLIFDQLNK